MGAPRVLETINHYYDDLALGDAFRSGRRTITEADLVAFTAFSGDRHPLHTDEVYAAGTPFGTRIAQGALTLAAATGLEYGLVGTGDKLVAFYGMDQVRFVKPVLVGDTIHVEGEIVELRDKGERGGVVTMRERIVNQRGEAVVTLDKRTLNLRRPAGVG